jgi:hypothetical protein
MTKNTHMVVINPSQVGRTSNNVWNIYKGDEKGGGSRISIVAYIYMMSMYAIITQMCLGGCD